MFDLSSWILIDFPLFSKKEDGYIFIEMYKESEEKGKILISKIDKRRGEEIKFNYDMYMSDMLDSYKNDIELVKRQTIIDLNRSNFYFNNLKIDCPCSFIERIYKKDELSKEDIYSIFLFSTQAAIAEPFGYLSTIFDRDNDDNKVYVGELDSNSVVKEKKIAIYVNINHKKKIVKINKKMRIFKINEYGEAETLNKLKLNIVLDLIKNNILFRWMII